LSKQTGSGKQYQLAKKTVGKMFDVEKMVEENVLSAVETMADILQNSKSPIAIKLSAAKFFIEAHAKFAKFHGKNPQPKDFCVDKTVTTTADEDDDKVINLKFGG
jgi:peptide methionine sulfoxide reductase MsrA